MTTTKAVARLNELLKLNPSYTKAKLAAFLTVDEANYSAKVIKEALNTVVPAKAKAVTFASEYYAWLAEAPRTEKEARDFIMGEYDYPATSDNVKKHLSHYVNIWALTVAVRKAVATKKGKKASK